MAKNNTITLYDLQLSTGCTISPFVWRTKYALKHKGFDIDLVPNGLHRHQGAGMHALFGLPKTG